MLTNNQEESLKMLFNHTKRRRMSDNIKTHLISVSEDGYRQWMSVQYPDPITGKYCVSFFTTWEGAEDPKARQVKHQIFVTQEELELLSGFMGRV